MPEIESLPFASGLKHPKYCPYHHKRGVAFEQFYTFRRFFNNKHKVGEILYQDRNTSINNLSFSTHDDRGKWKVMMASHGATKAEENEEKAPEPELEVNHMARQVQNLFNFMRQTNFDPNKCIATTKSIIELTDPSKRL